MPRTRRTHAVSRPAMTIRNCARVTRSPWSASVQSRRGWCVFIPPSMTQGCQRTWTCDRSPSSSTACAIPQPCCSPHRYGLDMPATMSSGATGQSESLARGCRQEVSQAAGLAASRGSHRLSRQPGALPPRLHLVDGRQVPGRDQRSQTLQVVAHRDPTWLSRSVSVPTDRGHRLSRRRGSLRRTRQQPWPNLDPQRDPEGPSRPGRSIEPRCGRHRQHDRPPDPFRRW